MNEFDQFVKHTLKAKHYIRYADDFVIFSEDKQWLGNLIPRTKEFLSERLILQLHPDKIHIKTLASGVDFLGWVYFSDHKVLRITTKRRMFKNIEEKQGNQNMMQSYLGLLKHGSTYKLQQRLAKNYDS